MIACLQEDRGIGYKGDLIHKIPEDMKRFRTLTLNRPIIMGRKTFESFPNGPLPKRTNIVLTSRAFLAHKAGGDVFVASDISMAMEYALVSPGNDEIFIIGGEKVYFDYLPFTSKLYLTMVKDKKPADTYFPYYDENDWKVEWHSTNNLDGLQYDFVNLVRK